MPDDAPRQTTRPRALPRAAGLRSARAAAGALAAATVIALLAGGCGDSRATAVSLRAAARPRGFESLRVPSADVSLRVPNNWLILRHERPPLRALIVSGGAVVALWRYAASQPPPADRAGLALDRTALLDGARAHGGLLDVYEAKLTSVDGAPAVQLDVRQRIGRAVYRTLSTHIYLPGSEVVLEESAPAGRFAQARREAFSAIVRSVRILPGA